MKYLFQFSLKTVLVLENGFAKEASLGDNILSVSLIAPTRDNKSIQSVKEIKLADQKVKNYGTTEFSERFLFKSIFEGSSSLKVEISARDKRTVAEKVLKAMLKAGLLAGTTLITGGGTISLVTAGIAAGITSVFDNTGKKDKLTSIGKGEMPIDNSTDAGDFVVQLAVPKDVKIFLKEAGSDGMGKTVPFKLPKGLQNAMVVFTIDKVPIGEKSSQVPALIAGGN